MSHQMGAIKFKDGTIGYFEYNGTTDIVANRYYATSEEVRDNWRKHDPVHCECGNPEPVMIFADYGGGYYLKGMACRTCNTVEADYDFLIIERYQTEDWAAELPEFHEEWNE